MRLSGMLPLTAAVLMTILVAQPAASQGWFEYRSVEDRFGVNLPAEPMVEEFEYLSEFDAVYPGRRHTVELATARYSVTTVDFTDAERIHAEMEKTEAASGANAWLNEQRASVAKAAREYRQRGGEVTYDAWSHLDLVEGHQLQITNPDSTRTFVGIYLHGHAQRLHILEATVAPGAPPPGHFQQSLSFLNEEGERVRHRLTVEGCSVNPNEI
ncbi:MAG TPA: hypothetical protein VIV14_04075 [Gammaproteobacteria bacterium]